MSNKQALDKDLISFIPILSIGVFMIILPILRGGKFAGGVHSQHNHQSINATHSKSPIDLYL